MKILLLRDEVSGGKKIEMAGYNETCPVPTDVMEVLFIWMH